MSERLAIAVLARAPVPGGAKTRLIPRLGAAGAAQLHAWLVRRALKTALEAELGPVTLWCAPDQAPLFFAACRAEHAIALADQPEGDLGARMAAAFAHATPALLIGTDCPALTPGHLRAAAVALAEHDAVFLPAEDGGYVLAGLRRPAPALFSCMVWSVDSVMDETRRRLTSLKLSWSEPATLWDVDRPEDYDRLVAAKLLQEAT